MISEQDHLRHVSAFSVDTTIENLRRLKDTQPPFSNAARAITEQMNTLRTVKRAIEEIELHG